MWIFYLFVLVPHCSDETQICEPCRPEGLAIIIRQAQEEVAPVPGNHTRAEPGNPTTTIQLLNIQKNLAAHSQGFTRGLLLLQPCVTTFGSVIQKLLFSHVGLNVHVFIFFHKLLWLAHGAKEKRGNYSFPQPRRGTEFTEWVFLWEGALSSRSTHKCESLIREWDPCLLQCHKSKTFSSLFFKHCYVPFGFISVMYFMNFEDFEHKEIGSFASFVSMLCAWLDPFCLKLRISPHGPQHSPLCGLPAVICLGVPNWKRLCVYRFSFVLSKSPWSTKCSENPFAW